MKKFSAIFFVAMILVSSNGFGMEEGERPGLQVISLEDLPKANFYEQWIKLDKCGSYEHGHAYWRQEDVIGLLDRSENPNQVCSEDYTPLHYVSSWGEEGKDLAKRLLAAGANPNVKNGRSCPGNTCLHDAVMNGKDDPVWIDILVDGKAIINATNDHGENILHIAIYLERVNVVKYLLNTYGHEMFDFPDYIYKRTPLEYAKY